jgi:hypothetical protein
MKLDELPETFATSMPDAALKGDIEESTEMIFERGSASAAPGKVVLVEDGNGNRFIRRYASVRGSHWRAVSSNGFFDPLDSIEHDLKVLAVMQWRRG